MEDTKRGEYEKRIAVLKDKIIAIDNEIERMALEDED